MKKVLAWMWIGVLGLLFATAIGIVVYQSWPAGGVLLGLGVGALLTLWAFDAVGLR